jgi:hypothetical protein
MIVVNWFSVLGLLLSIGLVVALQVLVCLLLRPKDTSVHLRALNMRLSVMASRIASLEEEIARLRNVQPEPEEGK